MRSARAAAALALVGALVGCSTTADSGQPASSFAAINTDIFEPNCTFACHSGGEFAAGGFDMKIDPYASLVREPPSAKECAGSDMLRVVPSKPEESLVYLKIRAKIDDAPAPCGEGMPSGANKPPLTEDEAETIRRWIEDGALDD